MPGKQELSTFIHATFRSVWSLELLCFLRKHPDCEWTNDRMVAALRASDIVIAQSLDSLFAAGLIVIGTNGTARYRPVSEKLDRLVAATEDLYLRQPDAVRRIIVATGASSLASFADAFKLRRD
jgi:hypothetical protein